MVDGGDLGDGGPVDFRKQLKWSLQALAQPAEVQLRLYPDGSAKADELALDFDHWRQCAHGRQCEGMTAEQRRLLDEVDSMLDRMSGESNSRYWTDDGLRTDPRWAELRDFAARALRAFGWENERPPKR